MVEAAEEQPKTVATAEHEPHKKKGKKSVKDLSYASLYSAQVREFIEKQEW